MEIDLESETQRIANLFYCLLVASGEGSVSNPFDVVEPPEAAQPLVAALEGNGWTMFTLGSKHERLSGAIPASMFFILPKEHFASALRQARDRARAQLKATLDAAAIADTAPPAPTA